MNGQRQPFAGGWTPEERDLAGAYDIVVFGGGSAGFAAAVQAARAGKRTALVEKNGMLGGTTTVAAVNFPGLFHAWGKQVIRGIGWEAIERTAALGGAELPDFSVVPDRHWKHQVLVNRFIYSAVLDEMCVEAGVTLRLHEMPAAVIPGQGCQYVGLTGKEGVRWFRARKLIDATGDANIAGMMGYARHKSELRQPGTLIHDLGGYDPSRVDEQTLRALFEEAVRKGELVGVRSDPMRDLQARRIQMHVQYIDGSDSESKTEAELKARRFLLAYVRLLRRVPGCEALEVRQFANECGIRETWRIEGETEVDEQDYVSGRLWPDAVCYSFYPIDLHHHSNVGIDQRMIEPGIVPTLPYRALIPKGSDDLLVAGRCAAGDPRANSAFRVQATCMATGQAAGMAAAIACERNMSVREVPLDLLRDRLERYGAIVPPGGDIS